MIPDRPPLSQHEILNDLREGERIIITGRDGDVNSAIVHDGMPRVNAPDLFAEFIDIPLRSGEPLLMSIRTTAGYMRRVLLDAALVWRVRRAACAGCGSRTELHHDGCPELELGSHDEIARRYARLIEPEPLPGAPWRNTPCTLEPVIPTAEQRADIDRALAAGFPQTTRAGRAPSAPDRQETTMNDRFNAAMSEARAYADGQPRDPGAAMPISELDVILDRIIIDAQEIDAFPDTERRVHRVATASPDSLSAWIMQLTADDAMLVIRRLALIEQEHRDRANHAERLGESIREAFGQIGTLDRASEVSKPTYADGPATDGRRRFEDRRIAE